MSAIGENWSRRSFVKTSVLAGAALQMPLWWQCVPDHRREQQTTLQALVQILMPQDEFGPGALDWQADRFVLWWMEDENIDPGEIEFVQNHLDSIEKEDSFSEKALEEREKLVAQWSKSEHHQSFLSKVLTLCFEAMVAHPLYGFSDDFQSVEWLEHRPGQPQPNSKELIYPQILKTIRKDD